jgi:hypothetical protein
MRDRLFLYRRWHSITLFSDCTQKRLYELEVFERHPSLSPIVIPAAGDKRFFPTTWTLGTSFQILMILEAPMLVAIWTTEPHAVHLKGPGHVRTISYGIQTSAET